MQTKQTPFHSPQHQPILWLSLLTFIISLCTSLNSIGQPSSVKFNPDSPKSISLNGFNDLVNKSITLLETKSLSEISDSDHVDIMMCLNTIFMTHKEGSPEKRFVDGIYQKLVQISDKIAYSGNIIKVYPDWVANRGMGFYFPKLKMELYGTPRPYAVFNVL